MIDLLLATRRREMTGVERFGIQLAKELNRQHRNVVTVLNDDYISDAAFRSIKMKAGFRNWLMLPFALKRNGLSTANVILPSFPGSPLFRFSGNSTFRVVHDAFPWTRRGMASLQSQIMFDYAEKLSIYRHEKVFSPTITVADELNNIFPRLNTIVCGNAIGLDIAGEVEEQVPLLGKSYCLAVGTVEPRKNYQRLLKIVPELAIRGWKLVIVGRSGWGEDVAQLEDISSDPNGPVIWYKDGEDKQLRWLYYHASCFISLSLAEGFNMPLAEAAAAGLPTVCSDIAIHRSVAPDWAYIASDEAGPVEIVNAISSQSMRGRHDGTKYIKQYSWSSVSRRMLESIIHPR
ncbi:glycosyltransferase [Ancylobacter sp. MQZ15Z-1]|uniref:Glycosyltransferase n=1 Tax=Ancylobacter mangrovi TaxID=2972472 RepID=A0A9X2PN74_9HYPH|nr:glycosyltransferase [Ancylobacter mangrovi]MCS0496873.1 glycosyltransferase [Ancylobacter mangrovi]